MKDNNNLARFLLTFFLGWIGSLIINHTSLKPNGWKSRTWAYFFWPMLTFGIYGLLHQYVIFHLTHQNNLMLVTNKTKNINYKRNLDSFGL